MTTTITATQALEWAKEDVEAIRPLTSTDDVIDILDRWIRRVEESKPTKPGVTYRDGGLTVRRNDPPQERNPVTARTGTPREARALSGCDVGRWLYIEPNTRFPGGAEWRPITHVHHNANQTVSIGLDRGGFVIVHPTDTVTIRGRDE